MKTPVKSLVLSALFIAIGITLPFLTGQLKIIGKMLLPMHLPVMLCGLICGWQYGLICGIITPLLRSVLFGMPILFPSAAAMSVELAVYGSVIGLLYRRINNGKVVSLYISLVSAMVIGRAIWGIVMYFFMFVNGNSFTFTAFIAGAFTDAFPGIILQLILIPAIMTVLHKAKIINVQKSK